MTSVVVAADVAGAELRGVRGARRAGLPYRAPAARPAGVGATLGGAGAWARSRGLGGPTRRGSTREGGMPGAAPWAPSDPQGRGPRRGRRALQDPRPSSHNNLRSPRNFRLSDPRGGAAAAGALGPTLTPLGASA